ncbi:TPA: hypothetical protein ACQUHP_005631 [Bacillus cereus]
MKMYHKIAAILPIAVLSTFILFTPATSFAAEKPITSQKVSPHIQVASKYITYGGDTINIAPHTMVTVQYITNKGLVVATSQFVNPFNQAQIGHTRQVTQLFLDGTTSVTKKIQTQRI